MVCALLIVVYMGLSAATETALRSSGSVATVRGRVVDLVSTIQSQGVLIKDSLTAAPAPAPSPTAPRSGQSRAESQAELLVTAEVFSVGVPEGIGVISEVDPAQLLDTSLLRREVRSVSTGSQPKASIKGVGKAKESPDSGQKIVARKGNDADHGKLKDAGHKGADPPSKAGDKTS